MRKRFTATLLGRGPKSAWTYLPIPFNVEETFGARGRVAVTGTINGSVFRNSLMPEGDGRHSMMVSKKLQAEGSGRVGDTVHVMMEVDREERTIDVPAELATALKDDRSAADGYAALAFSYRKEFADWIATAKRPETRSTRVEKALGLLRQRKKLT